MRAEPITTPSSGTPSTRAQLLPVSVLAAALAIAPGPAFAAEPIDIGGSYVLDEAGVLGADRERVETALDALFDDIGAPLLVVIVDTFEVPSNSADWADASAIASGLGERDALLAIAVEDRALGVSPGADFPVSDELLASAERESLIPALRDDRWADGIVDYAEQLGDSGRGSDSATRGSLVTLLLGAGILVVIIAIVVLVVRARRKGSDAARPPQRQSLEQLDRTASRRLVELDDALTTSEQELGFAEAQFGSDSVAGFRDALARARVLVTEAFRTRRQLDDDEPAAEVRREALLSIAAQCDEADALLAAQEEAFEALRAVEQDIAGALTATRAGLASAARSLEESLATLARLDTEYSTAALSAVADAPEQLPRLLDLADREFEAARAAHERSESSTAAIEVRSAQLVLAQIDSSANAVARLAGELAETRAALAAQRDDAHSGIESARALEGTRGAAPSLAGAIAAAERALAEADDRDPATSLARLVAADRALDAELADARADSDRRAASAAALERTLAAARSAILSAAEYIASHRGGVGATARAQLAEAQSQLDVALAERQTDAVAALETAQRAHELARRSLDAAEGDVRGALDPRGPVGSLLGGGGARSGGTGAGALAGGLIGGLLGSGAGRSRPSFGSSPSRRAAPARPSRSSRSARPARASRSRSGRSRGGRF